MSGWLAAFIVVACVAIVIQMAILLAMFVTVRTAIQNFTKIATDLQGRIQPILTRVTRIVDDSEDRIRSITTDTAEITRLARSQAQKVDRVFTDAVERLRAQVIRADHILTGTLEVIEEAGATFRTRLWKPVQQASALIKGFKAGLEILRGTGKPPESDPATQDEELFI
jgi:ABC-type transporter Mla subunit MlaD